MKKVKDYMCKEVFFVKPGFSVFEVARLFSKNRIAGAPVVDNGKVVGVVSDSDIVRFMSMKLMRTDVFAKTCKPPNLSLMLLDMVNMGKDYVGFRKELQKISRTNIGSMMTKKTISVDPETNLYEAAAILQKHDINRLPVIDKKGKLVGIICREDLVRSLIEE
jgi:CBS domain-containing protein